MPLAAELEQALAAALSTYEALGETSYAFGLYVVAESGLIVGSCYASEESTLRRADEYAWMLDGSATERARAIRWWDADWPHTSDLPRLFDRANELLATFDRARAAETYIDVVAQFEVPMLRGVFGVDRELVERSIARLNAPQAVARWRAECAEGERLYRVNLRS